MDTQVVTGTAALTKKKKHGKRSKGKKNSKPLPAHTVTKLFGLIHQLRQMKLSVTADASGRVIPYGLADFLKGTQNPVIRLKLSQNIISITLSTQYNTVFTINASVFTNISDLLAAFDEYRVLRGELQYWQALQTSASGSLAANGIGGACIDYANGVALASFDAMQSHDTAKIFHWYSCPGQSNKGDEPSCRWSMAFEPLPDEEWIDASTTNVTFCYWKPYLSVAQAAQTSSPGYLLGWMDFQFRGISS